MIDTYFPVLDDGFIGLKGYMGSDEEIEQAARVSYGKGTRKQNDTRNLIRYLMRHRHSTPFEMAEMKFHVRAPIYVIRQWFRHRTWSYNEYSGRYSVMIDSMEKTDEDKWRTQSTQNKQGSGLYLPEDVGHVLSDEEALLQQQIAENYQLNLEKGVAREQARKNLPVSNYSEFYGKCDLKNLLHFMGLRSDGHAQKEIRAYSDIIGGFVKELFPLTFEAWYDYAYMASNFTKFDKKVLQEYVTLMNMNNDDTEELTEEYAKSVGMSKREIAEFWDKINPPEEKDFSLDFSQSYTKSED